MFSLFLLLQHQGWFLCHSNPSQKKSKEERRFMNESIMSHKIPAVKNMYRTHFSVNLSMFLMICSLLIDRWLNTCVPEKQKYIPDSFCCQLLHILEA